MLTFNEIELNYILEAVQYFNEVTLRKVVRPEDVAVYRAELDGITEKILDVLSPDRNDD